MMDDAEGQRASAEAVRTIAEDRLARMTAAERKALRDVAVASLASPYEVWNRHARRAKAAAARRRKA